MSTCGECARFSPVIRRDPDYPLNDPAGTTLSPVQGSCTLILPLCVERHPVYRWQEGCPVWVAPTMTGAPDA